MKVFDSENIRNIVLVGHGDSGKTSLASALLYSAGAVSRLGRVEEGNTITDCDQDEIERKITISTALAHLEWKGSKVNILDTPGYRTFILDTKASMVGAETAVLVVDAASGVEVQVGPRSGQLSAKPGGPPCCLRALPGPRAAAYRGRE
jgi:elongation factor G